MRISESFFKRARKIDQSFVTGHDFSQAKKLQYLTWGFSPCGNANPKLTLRFAR